MKGLMSRLLTTPLIAAVLLLSQADATFAKSSGYTSSKSSSYGRSSSHSSSSRTYKSKTYSSSGTHHGGRQKAAGVKRDQHGKIARSEKAKDSFRKNHPCPSTGRTSGACPGYVIDHIRPLKKGGSDDPSNMQWQTKADAKPKDKWE